MPDVPPAPLPLVRHTRFLFLADTSERNHALAEVLSTTKQDLRCVPLQHALDCRLPLDADVILLSVDIDHWPNALARLEPALAGLVVVWCAVTRPQGPRATLGPGSALANVAAALPAARVIGAFQQFGTDHLRLMALGLLETDAPVLGDDLEAADLIEALLDHVSGVTGVYAGPLRGAGAVEGIATLLDEVAQTAGRPVGFRLDAARGLVLLFGR